MYMRLYTILVIKYDPDKSERCLRERGFDFDFAARIFLGPTVEREDDRRDYGEVRMVAIGMVEGRTLTVVYTDRDAMRWIISARVSEPRERRIYAEGT